MIDLKFDEEFFCNCVLVITTAFFFLLWFKWGRDRTPVVTVEFRPPEKLDPMEMDYCITENVSERSYFSMILYWANKGYVELFDTKKSAGAKRIREIPEKAPEHAKILFDLLFQTQDHISFASMPECLEDKEETFTEIMEKELPSVLDDAADTAVFISWFLFPGVVVYVLNSINDSGAHHLTYSLLIAAMIFVGLISVSTDLIGVKTTRVASMLITGIVLLIAAWGAAEMLIIKHSGNTIIEIMFTVCYLISVICISFMEKRSNTEIYGRILGFRKFIKTVEKNRLKELSTEDSQYGLEILPYAMLFGIGTKWTRKFENEVVLYDKEVYIEEMEQILDKWELDKG